MIKTLCLGLITTALLCGSAAAELSFAFAPAASVDAGMTTTVDVFVVSDFFLGDLLESANITLHAPVGGTGLLSSVNSTINYSATGPGIFGLNFQYVGPGIANAFKIGEFSFTGDNSIPATTIYDFTATGGIDHLITGYDGSPAGLSNLAVTVNAGTASVPEPTSVLLFGSLMTLGMIRRRSA